MRRTGRRRAGRGAPRLIAAWVAVGVIEAPVHCEKRVGHIGGTRSGDRTIDAEATGAATKGAAAFAVRSMFSTALCSATRVGVRASGPRHALLAWRAASTSARVNDLDFDDAPVLRIVRGRAAERDRLLSEVRTLCAGMHGFPDTFV